MRTSSYQHMHNGIVEKNYITALLKSIDCPNKFLYSSFNYTQRDSDPPSISLDTLELKENTLDTANLPLAKALMFFSMVWVPSHATD